MYQLWGPTDSQASSPEGETAQSQRLIVKPAQACCGQTGQQQAADTDQYRHHRKQSAKWMRVPWLSTTEARSIIALSHRLQATEMWGKNKHDKMLTGAAAKHPGKRINYKSNVPWSDQSPFLLPPESWHCFPNQPFSYSQRSLPYFTHELYCWWVYLALSPPLHSSLFFSCIL